VTAVDLPPLRRRRPKPFISAASENTEAEDEAQPGDEPPANTDKTGLLIIRAWVEEGSSKPLRADVRATTDVSAGFDRTVTLARPEEVGATVQEWLAEVLGDRGPREPQD
jgi:hypothetical protein